MNHLRVVARPGAAAASSSYRPATSPGIKDIDALISDPDIWPHIQSAVDEAVKAKGKITHEQENIKALREMTRDQFGLHPKLFNAYVAATWNNDYVQRLEGVTQEQVLLEHIMLDPEKVAHEGND